MRDFALSAVQPGEDLNELKSFFLSCFVFGEEL